jgi:formyltetrahydrofolate deformylase
MNFILTVQCVDQPGIVRAISTAIAGSGGNIVESAQFVDEPTGMFSLRMNVDIEESQSQTSHSELREVLARFDPIISFRPKATRRRMLVMVSLADHCLLDLFYHWQLGELPVDIVGVVSNHNHLRELVEGAGLTFHLLPITSETKPKQELALRKILVATQADFVVLARYMQVLSDELCRDFSGRIINIHHSFLPGFKGARPYRQAFHRGVKMIGATAHFVTPELDEGPIIDQDVTRVSHAAQEQDLVSLGRDVERRLLTRSIRLVADDRVMLVGSRTVVFDQ